MFQVSGGVSDIPNELRDASSAAIMASAFYEPQKYSGIVIPIQNSCWQDIK
ncbi:MAG TPA: hypothetical protein VF144_16405 [Chitinophagaceae bacterium]